MGQGRRLNKGMKFDVSYLWEKVGELKFAYHIFRSVFVHLITKKICKS